MIQLRARRDDDQPWIEALLRERWGTTMLVVHGVTLDAARAPALVAEDREGLATYAVSGTMAELITLDARRPRQGVGSALLEGLAALLARQGVRRLLVTTTNDNLDALRFYQRRGFRIVSVRPGAVDAARRLKPAIPMTGAYGIPLRDELELVRDLAG